MSALAYLIHRTHFRHPDEPDDIGPRVEHRQARLRYICAICIAGALVAGIGVASGWAVVGLAAYVASLAPLIVLSW